jgi:hypothetical protein
MVREYQYGLGTKKSFRNYFKGLPKSKLLQILRNSYAFTYYYILEGNISKEEFETNSTPKMLVNLLEISIRLNLANIQNNDFQITKQRELLELAKQRIITKCLVRGGNC